MNTAKHKIIFEGPELSGKSYLMSQLFDFLEPKYNSGRKIMDGCHWFNCDVGVYGTKYGQEILQEYLKIIKILAGTNVMVEKFHLTEAVYQKLYDRVDYDFKNIEKSLVKLNARIILTTFDEDEELIRKRLEDRLQLYPHYQRIAQKPKDYIQQQRMYLELVKRSRLDYLVVNASQLPNEKLVEDILKFLGEI